MSSRTAPHRHVPGSATRQPRAPRFWRRVGQVALVLLALILVGTAYEAVSERVDAQRFPLTGRLIDVGGYRLHLDCQGQGRPVVVIDAGWGDWSLPWRRVQALAARTTTVCTYDRAGMGQSEAGPAPRDAAHFGAELYTLLHRADIQGPYVLVGHSLGGLTVRAFTGRYRAEVQGVVLIDSMAPELGQFASRATPSASLQVASPQVASPLALSMLTLPARVGLVRLLAGPLSQGVAAEDRKQYAATIATPRYAQTVAEEGAGMPAGLQQAAQVTSFGTLPLVVLSRGLDLDPAWQAKQQALLRLSTNSLHLIAAHSTHTIESDEPEAAVAAITRMVAQLR